MAFVRGKVAIVTGGCSGIGLAVVHNLLENKAAVIWILYRNIIEKLAIISMMMYFLPSFLFQLISILK